MFGVWAVSGPRAVELALAYQRRHKEKGLCTRCPRKAAVRQILQNGVVVREKPMSNCDRHLDHQRKRQRKWLAKKGA